MTREDIIKLAREAGIKNDCDGIWCNADQLIAFAALVAAAEREACAKVCEEAVHNATDWDSYYWDQACINRALAIRARGQR